MCFKCTNAKQPLALLLLVEHNFDLNFFILAVLLCLSLHLLFAKSILYLVV